MEAPITEQCEILMTCYYFDIPVDVSTLFNNIPIGETKHTTINNISVTFRAARKKNDQNENEYLGNASMLPERKSKPKYDADGNIKEKKADFGNQITIAVQVSNIGDIGPRKRATSDIIRPKIFSDGCVQLEAKTPAIAAAVVTALYSVIWESRKDKGTNEVMPKFVLDNDRMDYYLMNMAMNYSLGDANKKILLKDLVNKLIELHTESKFGTSEIASTPTLGYLPLITTPARYASNVEFYYVYVADDKRRTDTWADVISLIRTQVPIKCTRERNMAAIERAIELFASIKVQNPFVLNRKRIFTAVKNKYVAYTISKILNKNFAMVKVVIYEKGYVKFTSLKTKEQYLAAKSFVVDLFREHGKSLLFDVDTK